LLISNDLEGVKGYSKRRDATRNILLEREDGKVAVKFGIVDATK